MTRIRRGRWLLFVCGATWLPHQAYPQIDAALELTQNRDSANLRLLAEAFRDAASATNAPNALRTLFEQVDASGSAASTLTALRTLLPAQQSTQLLRLGQPLYRLSTPLGLPQTAPASPPVLSLAMGFEATPDDRATTWLKPTEFWLHSDIASSKQDARSSFDAFEADTHTISAGLDFSATERLRWGVFGQWANTDIDAGLNGDDDIDHQEVGISLSWRNPQHGISVDISRAQQSTDRIRSMLVDSANTFRRVDFAADIDSQLSQVSIGYDYTFRNADFSRLNWFLTPSISFSYAKLETDDYVETATQDIALAVATEDATRTTVGLGLHYNQVWFVGDWMISPFVRLNWSQELSPDPVRTAAGFRDRSFNFTTDGYDIEDNQFSYGVGVNFVTRRAFSFGIGYSAIERGDYTLDSIDMDLSFPL